MIFTGGGGSRNRTVGRDPFFSGRGSTFLCDSSSAAHGFTVLGHESKMAAMKPIRVSESDDLLKAEA